MKNRLPVVVFAAAIVSASTGAAVLLRPYLAPLNLAMIYMLGVATVAVRFDWLATVLTSAASVVLFDLFCVPPYRTVAIADPQYAITFAAMLALALIMSAQTARIRAQAREAEKREARTAVLHRLTTRLAGETRILEAAQVAAEMAEEALSLRTVIFLSDKGQLSFQRRTSIDLPVPASEETLARWVFQHGQNAGVGVDTLFKSHARYLPLSATREPLGVMAVLASSPRDLRGNEMLADLLAHQTAVALERIQSHNAAESARLRMQTEQMRSSLLSAVSHDLRTPLASIAGAATTLRDQGPRLSPEIRQDLLESITEESERLGRLVSNLIDMTRFDSGAVTLRRESCTVDDIVGAALARLKSHLHGREIATAIPASLPLVFVDEVLIAQVFLNILENASKYAPAESPIEIDASRGEDCIWVEIRDHGQGFPPGQETRLFDKFYRAGQPGPQGAGLGLAIANAIVEAHGGHISAFNHPSGGAVFRFSLPIQDQPHSQPAEQPA